MDKKSLLSTKKHSRWFAGNPKVENIFRQKNIDIISSIKHDQLYHIQDQDKKTILHKFSVINRLEQERVSYIGARLIKIRWENIITSEISFIWQRMVLKGRYKWSDLWVGDRVVD